MPGRAARRPSDDERVRRDAQRRAFAEELGNIAQETGLSQAELARRLGMAQQTISKYIAAEQPPENPEIVFEIERKLGIPPGGLSHHLGYVPVVHVSTPEAIANDPALPPEARKLLRIMYLNLLIVVGSRGDGSPRA